MIDTPTMKAIVAEAHKAGARVAVHATSEIGIQSAIDAGADSIEHGDSATERQFQEMREKGIVLVPTLWPGELHPGWPDLVAVDAPARLRHMDREAYLKQNMIDQNAKMERARKAGVKMAFGSDEWYERASKTRGEATLELLAGMGKFGVTGVDALRAATINAAELLEVANVAGSIEAKKFGDLVGVEGDPLQNLDDVRKVRFVMKGGRVVRDDGRR